MQFWKYIINKVKNKDDQTDELDDQNSDPSENSENSSEESASNDDSDQVDENSDNNESDDQSSGSLKNSESNSEESTSNDDSDQVDENSNNNSNDQSSDSSKNNESNSEESTSNDESDQNSNNNSNDQSSDSLKNNESNSEESTSSDESDQVDENSNNNSNDQSSDSSKNNESNSEESTSNDVSNQTNNSINNELDSKSSDSPQNSENSNSKLDMQSIVSLQNYESSNDEDFSSEESLKNNSNDVEHNVEDTNSDFADETTEQYDIADLSNDEVSETDNIVDDKTNSDEKELLEKLRDKIQAYAAMKSDLEKTVINNEKEEITESVEEDYSLSDKTNKFLDELSELPSFEDRDRSPGYAIDVNGNSEVPDSVIRTLISKFLNQRFCKSNTDLNVRSNSLEKVDGFHKWNVKDVVVHLKTEQITKVLNDKHGFQYADGNHENVPLSFYFDLSGSMSSYTNLLAVMAIELLKKNVKVLVGFNERADIQINKIKKDTTIKEIVSLLQEVRPNYHDYSFNSKIDFTVVNANIDNYLIAKRAEKCVIFSDFDAIREIANLSNFAQVYLFCFENNFSHKNINDYKANMFTYKVKGINDIEKGLIKVNSKRFKSLCYADKEGK